MNAGPLPPPGVHNHGRRVFVVKQAHAQLKETEGDRRWRDPEPRHVTQYRSFLQVCQKALGSSGLTSASRRKEPSRSWTEPFPRAPLSRSPSSSLTIRAIITRPSHPWQHTWHLKLGDSADRFTTRRGASGTFHCHHYPGTWLSQLQFFLMVSFTTSFSPFCCYFPFFLRLFCLIHYFHMFILIQNFLFLVGSSCDLCASLFLKCPVCVERYDHLQELCAMAELALWLPFR